MKKLLYTLLIGLVVISCEKDMDMDTNSIYVPSQDIELIDSSTDNLDIDASISRLLGKVNGLSVKGSAPSTSKTAIAGSNILFLVGSGASGIEYEIFLGDDVSVCIDADEAGVDFLNLYLVYESASSTTVRLNAIDGTVLSTITRDLTAAFELDNLFLGDKIDGNTQTITPGAGSGTSITF